MSRPQLSQDQKQRIFSSFVNAAWNILQSEGMGGLTLRKVSAAADHNSATLYQHFQDLDELTAYASLRYLRDYGLRLVDRVQGMEDPVARYYTIWTQFCALAFRYPEPIYALFFGPYSDKLGEMMARYYAVFPEDREALESEATVNRLFRHGPLPERTMSLLLPIAEAGLLDRETLPLRNDMLIYCFKELLSQKMRRGDGLDSAQLTETHMAFICLALGVPRPAAALV